MKERSNSHYDKDAGSNSFSRLNFFKETSLFYPSAGSISDGMNIAKMFFEEMQPFRTLLLPGEG